VLDINALPTDVTQLQRLLIEHHTLIAAQSVDLRTKQRQIEHLKFQLAKLRRFRFGQSSERLEGIEQMVLSLEALEASVAQAQGHGICYPRHRGARERAADSAQTLTGALRADRQYDRAQ